MNKEEIFNKAVAAISVGEKKLCVAKNNDSNDCNPYCVYDETGESIATFAFEPLAEKKVQLVGYTLSGERITTNDKECTHGEEGPCTYEHLLWCIYEQLFQ